MATPEETRSASASRAGCSPTMLKLMGLMLVVTLPCALFAYDVWRVVFNPTLVKEVLTDEVLNSDLVPVALAWFSERRAQQRVEEGIALTGVDEPDIILLLSYMDVDDWRAIKGEVLTDEFLVNLTSVTVDGTYSWIDSDDRVPQIVWDLRPFKDRVDTEHGVNAISIAYDNLPDCTEDQVNDFLARLSAAPPNTEVLYNLCEFPDPWYEDQFSDYLNSLYKLVDNVDSDFNLTGNLAQADDQGGVGPDTLKTQLRAVRFAAHWAWVLPMALVIGIAFFAPRSIEAAGRFLGRPLVWGAGLTLFIALVLRFTLTGILSAGVLSETPDLVRAEADRIIGRLAGEIFNPMLLQGGVLLLLGIGLLILARRKMAPVSAEQTVSA